MCGGISRTPTQVVPPCSCFAFASRKGVLTNSYLPLMFYNKNINIKKSIIQFGECANDLLEAILEPQLSKTNRFYKNKIIRNMLSMDVCYWILNDCFKLQQDKWVKSMYKNYEYSVQLELFPHILNYILFMMNFWLQEIRKLYGIPSNLNMNVKELFIAKYSTRHILTEFTQDEGFFMINIQLNSESDYANGKIVFQGDEEPIQLCQTDCVVYSGKRSRTPGNVSSGEKYVLSIIIEALI